MIDSKVMKQESDQWVEAHETLIRQIATYLHAHPELGEKEYLAARYLRHVLAEAGFTVTDCVPERFPTAFQATYGTGPVQIGFLAEYDALPGLGHGCGHNLIAAMSVGAALAFAAVAADVATIHVYGCPAEETAASKEYMSAQGVFDGLTAALIIHPGEDKTALGGTSYATHPLEFAFTGKPAHVADPDYHGINALDAAVDFYQALKEKEKEFTERHIIGIIFTEAGTAPNIVPDRAVLHATIRAMKADYLEGTMLPAIRALAQAVSDRHGTTLSMVHYDPLLKDMVNDPRLDVYFAEAFSELGEEFDVKDDDYAEGSTDVGNVSQVTRTSQPSLCIGYHISGHTPEFACAAGSEYALQQAALGAKAMARVAADVVAEQERPPVAPADEEAQWRKAYETLSP